VNFIERKSEEKDNWRRLTARAVDHSGLIRIVNRDATGVFDEHAIRLIAHVDLPETGGVACSATLSAARGKSLRVHIKIAPENLCSSPEYCPSVASLVRFRTKNSVAPIRPGRKIYCGSGGLAMARASAEKIPEAIDCNRCNGKMRVTIVENKGTSTITT
jgi:hypothetical protein